MRGIKNERYTATQLLELFKEQAWWDAECEKLVQARDARQMTQEEYMAQRMQLERQYRTRLSQYAWHRARGEEAP